MATIRESFLQSGAKITLRRAGLKHQMIFITISGFFDEPNPDDSLQYKKDVPQALEGVVLNVMGWSILWDVPMGEHKLSTTRASTIMELIGDSFRDDLVYYMGLCQV